MHNPSLTLQNIIIFSIFYPKTNENATQTVQLYMFQGSFDITHIPVYSDYYMQLGQSHRVTVK